MRPLRRSGATPDVLWAERVIIVRRSQTVGDEVMESTKTGRRQRINIPDELIAVLRWHIDTQLTTPEQIKSELLFPALTGGFRAENVLQNPFNEVAKVIGLKKHISPRAMRRTFNDLARLGKVEAVVTKSISGHVTDAMRDHYSTVNPVEQREGIGRVISIMEEPATADGGALAGALPAESGAPKKKAS